MFMNRVFPRKEDSESSKAGECGAAGYYWIQRRVHTLIIATSAVASSHANFFSFAGRVT